MTTDSRAADDRPLVVLHTAPQPVDRIFTSAALAALNERFRVVDLEQADDPDRRLDELLPQAFAVVGQPDLPTERVELAGKLRALLNVEGNFYPNVDYPACFDRGIHVLGCGPAYAQAVAEYALGLALDLARGISREDRAFREGRERYLGAGNADAVLLRHADVGLIGYGNLGRALRPLLAPFSPTIRVYDPWLPASVLREADLIPSSLEEVLSASTFVFVLAAVTSDSQHLLGGPQFDLLQNGSRLILVSRAAVADFPALLDRVAAGKFLAAIDVWPAEPVDTGRPVPAAGRPGALRASRRWDTGRVHPDRRHGGGRPDPDRGRTAPGPDAGGGPGTGGPLPEPAGRHADRCATIRDDRDRRRAVRL